MIFKCKNCGGNVVYSPERHAMFCPFCESENSESRQDGGQSDLSVCPNCGGQVPVAEHTSATQCPYCDNYLIFDERVKGQYAPGKIIPFQMGKESCKNLLREKLKKHIFAPTDFLSESKLNGIQGIYVPYWFYDYDTDCGMQAEGTRVRTWRSGDLMHTETSYYNIVRNMEVGFRDIPVDASVQMPDDIMDLVEPFGYDQLEEFQEEYLSGFYAEKYNMTSDLVESRAVKKRDDDVAEMFRPTYSAYSNVRILNQNVQVKSRAASYGLLPVWRYDYQYKDKLYPFYVNGQTGKIVGTAPLSRAKVWAYAGTLWACLTLILVFANNILRWL